MTSSNVSICGIPVVLEVTPELTVIQTRWGSMTPIQSKIISGWLQHKGNVAQVEPNAIKVIGSLADGSIFVPKTK